MIRSVLVALALFAGLFAQAAPAQMQVLETPAAGAEQGPCAGRTVTIAQMPWQTAAILARIHAQLIEQAFGCFTQVSAGDPSATISSMATTSEPAIAPELWVSRTPEIWNGALDSGNVRSAGSTYGEGEIEAWYVPRYVVEDNPGLESAADLIEHWQVFAPEDGETASFVSCPPDWACALLNRNLLGAHGLDERFEIVEPADRLALDRRFAEAVTRREAVVGYYWQPNALISQLDLVPLDMGEYDSNTILCLSQRDCVAFNPSAFAPYTVITAAAAWIFADTPEVAAYLQRARMPFAEMNALLAWQVREDASAQETAAHFVATREAVWRDWVGP